MIAKIMKGVAPGQEAGEEESDKAAGMDCEGLEASPHADTTLQGEPEKRQQEQQQPKLSLPLNVPLKPQFKPEPTSAPTLACFWETVQLRTPR